MLRRITGILLGIILLVAGFPVLATPVPVLAEDMPSTTITITKYASDNVTILEQVTKEYTWLRDNLPIQGDGVTHYYHQGPTLDPENLWDPAETVNVESRDFGAANGTDIRDLFDLVGGAPAGSVVEVLATDNYSKAFSADALYDMADNITPVLTWYNDTFGGDVPDYTTGMRLIFFDSKTNGEGKHVYGNWDMQQTLPENDRHYHYDSGTLYPSSGGLSVRNIDRIDIFTNVDVLFDGEIYLEPGTTFEMYSYYSGANHTVNMTTPLGALEAASQAASFTYDVSDKKLASMGIMLLDNIGTYEFDSPGEWYCYVNDVYRDGWADAGDAINNLQLANGDTVDYLYAAGVGDPADYAGVLSAATAAVIIDVSTVQPMDVLFDGEVYLEPGTTFEMYSYYSGANHTVNMTTPLGALHVAADTAGFTYDVSDKKYESMTIMLLDNIGAYEYDSPGEWYCYVNDVYRDGWASAADAINNLQLVNDDTVEYLYAAGAGDPADYAGVLAAATAAVIIDVSTTPPMDVLFEGEVYLEPGTTFEMYSYYSGANHTVNMTTPVGALHVAADTAGFTYDVSDKKYESMTIMLLDNIGTYEYDSPGEWYCYVNDVYRDGWADAADAINNLQLVNDDTVDYLYAAGVGDPSDMAGVLSVATAAVIIEVSTTPPMDILFEGTVNLTPGDTFTVTAYDSSTVYTVNMTTPLGALETAGVTAGFGYDVTDKNYGSSGSLLLDNIGDYDYNSPGKWYAYVNNVYKDGWNNGPDALNLMEVIHGDSVEYYYAEGVADPTDMAAVSSDAIAAVKTYVYTGVVPETWTLELSGALDTTVTRTEYEAGIACPTSDHYVEWTDEDLNVWGGVPLWLLVAMVDDNPDTGPDHYNFNDTIAAAGYSVKVISGDGWSTTLASDDIARDDGYIVANTLNGEQLPLMNESDKPCWPLHLKGPEVFGGQQVGNIVRIELTGLPEPEEGWKLELLGEVGDVITQTEFEAGLACPSSGHYVEWTDNESNVWSGVPLWVVVGAVDDIEAGTHWTFSDTVAAEGYTVEVIAADNYTKAFSSADIARSNNYILASRFNGNELGDDYPLRLVGDNVTKADGSLGGSAVGNIAKIKIPELMTPEPVEGDWNLKLFGIITDVISSAEFQAALDCPGSGHYVEWTDNESNIWSGIPLYCLAGWVDDRQPHDFNTPVATAGYTVLVKAGDGYARDFNSQDIAGSTEYIIANKINGENLTDPSWPLRLVGNGVANEGALTGSSIRNVCEIELIDFNPTQEIPGLHIIKYDTDGVSILNETTVDYPWMEANLDVIGDGTTVYKFEGITGDPEDIWDEAETCPGGYKVANAVKGSKISDLCNLVGGMGAGTEIKLIANDGYETALPYSAIYPDPAVYARQGDAVLAWWADGQYVPYYNEGMRLFFTPDDTIYGQWDMHETLPENYWHYYYDSGDQVLYPSCAGLSAKYITTIEIYSTPPNDWTLVLDGEEIGGLHQEVSRTYFEQALACQFGANHEVLFTDELDNEWGGMPLWLLAGFVDDQDMHSDESFNDELAAAGYHVVITNTDNHSVVVKSQDIIRNNDYIVANTLNGNPLPDAGDDWPLTLVGPGVHGVLEISAIERIQLSPVSVEVAVKGPEYVPEAYSFVAPVEIRNVVDFDAIQYEVMYDPAMLVLEAVTPGMVDGEEIPVMFNINYPGKCTVVQNIEGLAGVSGNGTLALLHFHTTGDTGDVSPIDLCNGVLSNIYAQEVLAAWFGQMVEIGMVPGDANGDGKLNAVDLTMLERIIAQLDPGTPTADANMDGEVDALDITKIERLIVGLD